MTTTSADALAGRAVLVTGGGSGIGRATALAAGAAGAGVTVVDKSQEGIDETIGLVTDAGGRAIGASGDVSDEQTMTGAVERTIAELGRLDGLVTCAGIFVRDDLQPLADVSLETFMHVLAVNLAGTFLAIKHAVPHLERPEGEQHGSIVTIASTAAIRGHGYGSGYTASKGGVAALTRLTAVEYGPRGVRANCICPGGVDTPMSGGVWNSEEARARTRERVPLGKIADARDIADVATFLLSDAARHLTGQTIAVDGGTTVAG